MSYDEHLAYGELPGPSRRDRNNRGQGGGNDQGSGDGEGTERSLFGDTLNKLKKNEGFASVFNKVHDTVHSLGTDIGGRVAGYKPAQQLQQQSVSAHRYGSFASTREGNNVKWHVDGCSYMWAVSVALERAKQSIWILDWWLSPELYLRRPPAKNEQYRVDRMLQAAAQRGVQVYIIVYKEVTQALTRKYLTPTLPQYLRSFLPRSEHDVFTPLLGTLGIAATFWALEKQEEENPLMAPPVPVSSAHTKHELEALHPSIKVFRHPDHLPDAQTLQSSFNSSFQNLSLSASSASKMSGDTLKALFGTYGDTVLYWAHHEKLCLVDGQTAFMGGLDLCYGRWDTNNHPLADAHPEDLDKILFPGQDFNNARIMDFYDVPNWQNNKLDRRDSARMGWSDVSVSLQGPVVDDLRQHFIARWNFIYNEKYDVRQDKRYTRLGPDGKPTGHGGKTPPPRPEGQLSSHFSPPAQQQQFSQGQQQYPPPPGQSQQYPPPPKQEQEPYYPPPPGQAQGQQSQYKPYHPGGDQQSGSQQQQQQQQSGYNPDQPYFPPPPTGARGIDEGERGFDGERGFGRSGERHHHLSHLEDKLHSAEQEIKQDIKQELHARYRPGMPQSLGPTPPKGPMNCQIVRSACKWSNGTETEHSIQNAYCTIIQNSQHFVYIENQFFITATGDKQKPVKNQIGAALVERILRAARSGQKYKVIVIMPAVPAFAGDLREESALGTRAIMEFQYNSINRGGNSIMEKIAEAGFEPMEYIRFYNLRNYDRIHTSSVMSAVEQQAGVSYEEAHREHDHMVDASGHLSEQGQQGQYGQPPSGQQNYQKYQRATEELRQQGRVGSGRWDSVSECYMLNGRDVREVPWDEGGGPEIDAFVSEELYVHTKVLIADDRIVICGSANLNDRSQLGFHDSELAIIVEDPEPLDSQMNGQPWRANRFAATLRRQLFRKHLGLIPAQDPERPDNNFEPIDLRAPNAYDYGSPEDRVVSDPLAPVFLNLWNSRASQNTAAFSKIFHPVPNDEVRTWQDYDSFYEANFGVKDEGEGKDKKKVPVKYKVGHVVKDNFAPGPEGLKQIKDLLATIKGTLVEMPLMFLIKEDIAKEGLSLNAFTEEVYT